MQKARHKRAYLLYAGDRHQGKSWGKTVLWRVCCRLSQHPRHGWAKSGWLRASTSYCCGHSSQRCPAIHPRGQQAGVHSSCSG